ncbi:MAG: hypothetical protein IPM37_23165 [Hahellaceae bacterium]|nr:hypothetical protein [Hahellaceae bacterium]
MNSEDWKALGRKVANFAPVLGTALGGPAGGAIGAIVAQTLGTENDPAAVAESLTKDPEAIVKLRALENEEKANLRSHVFGMARVEVADRANARANNKGHWMPWALTLVTALMTTGIAYMLMTQALPPGAPDIIYLISGQVLAAFIACVNYWVGSSRGSAEKAAMMGQSK